MDVRKTKDHTEKKTEGNTEAFDTTKGMSADGHMTRECARQSNVNKTNLNSIKMLI